MTALDLSTLHLDDGSHLSFEGGHCLMEAAAYFAGEPHTDRPQCVSPYLRSFGIILNDRVSDEQRQDLVRFVPLVVGTAGDGLDDRRMWLAADHVIRVTVPMWLDLAGLTDHAAILRAFAPIMDRPSWQATRPAIRAARDSAWALRSDRLAKIRADVTAAVRKALAERPDVAADVAVDVAAAADVDVASAAAADVAAAAAADVAAAAAAASASAAAADVAAAAASDVAAAVASDVASDADYGGVRRAAYDAVYDAVYAKMRAVYGERFATVAAAAWPDALSLYERLINPVAA
jgi:hypothetical protein